jgi:SAM-dependent methyltransferase
MSETPDREPRRLNVGCGHDVRAGWVNLDAAALPGVDVVHDLSSLPWPFPANRFDEILMINVLEHLENIVRNMEELHRISAPGARLTIRVPYWNSPAQASDPTHKSMFNEVTFDFFDPTTRHGRERAYYTSAKFRIRKKTYFTLVSERLPNPRVTWAPIKLILKLLARHLGGIIWAIEVELEVLKT